MEKVGRIGGWAESGPPMLEAMRVVLMELDTNFVRWRLMTRMGAVGASWSTGNSFTIILTTQLLICSIEISAVR